MGVSEDRTKEVTINIITAAFFLGCGVVILAVLARIALFIWMVGR